ncbi:multicopper oxidase domain-containing protein [Streptomyces sp. ME03-5709C]|nr:multicopper oxidase domain-containing protein [Streptomyces sp. ME03-5709C]
MEDCATRSWSAPSCRSSGCRPRTARGAPHRWFDTVNVPARGDVVIRIPFTDFTGRTVLHCHILNHEDMGMMAVLDIVPPRPGGK